MSRFLMTTLCATCAILLAAGCAQRAPEAAMEKPVIRADAPVPESATFLERYQEINRAYNLEKARAGAMAADLGQTQNALSRLQAEHEKLRKDAAVLEMKARELDEVRARNEETQKANLELDRQVRTLRRELLEERLASARQEQTILSLKIERAMERRRQAVDKPAEPRLSAAPAAVEGGGNAATR